MNYKTNLSEIMKFFVEEFK